MMASAAGAADVTTVICARNAAATIARAVRSAVVQGGPVIVVDDGSSDATAMLAHQAGGDAVSVVRPAASRTLGHARNVGLAAVTTPWLQWLDADDEVQPGRAAYLRDRAAGEGWDGVWDAAELFDGASGRRLHALPMPPFMAHPAAAVRLFERNHVPGPAWPLLRTAAARSLGYDDALPTADDLDFLLRGVCAGRRWGFVTEAGYRQYAYPDSLSRRRAHQRQWVAAVLGKHRYRDVHARYRAAGWPDAVAAWALVSMATFREDWNEALDWLDVLDAASDVPEARGVLEAEGPWPFPEAWRRGFHRGTLVLLRGDSSDVAAHVLERAEQVMPSVEGANNLGVAYARLGRREAAAAAFATALERLPGYADAGANAASATPDRITTHPLRRIAARADYA